MANPEHVDVVKRGWQEIRQWREKHVYDSLDLCNAALGNTDLRKADLSKADLRGAILFEADLFGANFGRANLSTADLRRARLVWANLRKANLREANLGKAKLDGAYLQWTDLRKADLGGADLDAADLHYADLRQADLSEANLREANFSEANLGGAILHKANFTSAILSSTVLGDIDLSVANGLECVRHHGPSTVGTDTLYKSGGKIPVAFLRGCGVPESLIEHLPSLTAENTVDFYSCFISYSHADKPFARRLHDALQGRGIRCWLDEHQILPGDDIQEQVDQAIRLWDKVLLCASENSLKQSWWVDGEMNRAFQKEARIMKERGRKVLALIPLNLDGFLFEEWSSGKATEVKARLAADFTGWESDSAKFEREFEKVVKALRADDGGRDKPPDQKL